MGLFKKKADPFSERARVLSAEITALESKIQKLHAQADKAHPRVRSTALPHGPTIIAHPLPISELKALRQEPIFEEVDQKRLKSPTEITPDQLDDLGLRKYDLAALWRRWKNQWRGQSAANPKLINYLAAGSIQGLRPLRYEKRVARNRFIFLTIFFLLILWGIMVFFFKRH
ncbi:MAG: hypothetical protein M3Y82_14065 [Verrucomicrobiota bacterium]|nr:hypothetical protein [Verrucomicrobiota bacterium]